MPGDVSLEVVGQLGGRLGETVAVGSHLYAGVGSQVVSFSIADSGKLKAVGGSLPLPEVVEGLDASGTLLVAATGPAGIQILDITVPTQPELLGALDLPGYAEDVDLVGGRVFVADGTGGLRIIDVADPGRPVELAVAYEFHNIQDVVVGGGRAFLAAADEGLLVADASDPSAPVEAGSLATGGFAFGVAVSSDTAYLADGWGGLQIIDVSNPFAPKKVGRSRTTAWAMDVTVQSGKAYVAAGAQGLRIVDVRRPSKPVLLGAVAMKKGHANDVFVRSGTGYVSDIFNGFRVVDVRSPERPKAVALNVPLGTVRDIALKGQYAFLAADTAGVRVIDVSDPARPDEVGSISTPAPALTAATIGTRLFTVTNFFGDTGAPRIVTLDAADPARLRAVSTFMFGREGEYGPAHVDAQQGEILYVPNEWGMSVIDGSRDAPCELAFLQTQVAGTALNSTKGVGVSGAYAYLGVLDAGGGVWTVDISDHRDPRVVDRLLPPGPPGIVATLPVGDTLFALTTGPGWLYTLDISDPAHPEHKGTLELPSALTFGGAGWNPLAYEGGRLFVADADAGLVVVDVSDRAAPRVAGRIRLPGRVVSVEVRGEFAYVGSVNGGFSIVRWTAASAQASTARVPRTNSAHGPAVSRPTSTRSSAASLCVVKTLDDSGAGSLRWCLERQGAGGIINFAPSVFPQDQPGRIRVTSLLPEVGAATIDGSGAGVILDGQNQVDAGLTLGDRATVKGIQIENFLFPGIEVAGADATVEDNVLSGNGLGIHVCCLRGQDAVRARIVGNRIGTTPDGTAASGAQEFGILLRGKGAVVGGEKPEDRNLVSGNTFQQIVVDGSSGNKIIGNYIGTDVTGTSNLGPSSTHSTVPIYVQRGSSSNLIANNVISGNDVRIDDPRSYYNAVVGNRIGVDPTGEIPLTGGGQSANGVSIWQPFNLIEDNVINGRITMASSDSIALGNRVGVGLDGNVFLGSTNMLEVLGGRHNVIGGHSEGTANVVVGDEAIPLHSAARDNVVIGNLVGTDGTAAYPTGDGIVIRESGPNFIARNVFERAMGAAVLLDTGAFANSVVANTLRSSAVGVQANDCESNLIFGNAFFGNQTQATDDGAGNGWDDGQRGNYWSDYTGQDADGDGIGDTPREVPPNGVDRFPLMVSPL